MPTDLGERMSRVEGELAGLARGQTVIITAKPWSFSTTPGEPAYQRAS